MVIDSGMLGVVAELGVGLAGFSGIAIVFMRGGENLSRIETDRLGIMLGVALGATFLAVLPLTIPALNTSEGCRIASGIMALYTAGFLWYYTTATLGMKPVAPELVSGPAFFLCSVGHFLNMMLQFASLAGVVACGTAYGIGLAWLLFHAAYQFGRIMFIRPRSL